MLPVAAGSTPVEVGTALLRVRGLQLPSLHRHQALIDRPAAVAPELLEALESAARLQEAVPEAVLVGDSAAAWYAGHRLSFDHDHVVADLRNTVDLVLEAIEATDGWVTNRVVPYKIILGRLGDIEAGVRQLRRSRPLEVAEVRLPSGLVLRVPTADETLRVKAYLLTSRNRVRDHLDVAALTALCGVRHAADVLLGMDDYYEDQHHAAGETGGVRSQLVRQLSDPRPSDTRVLGELSTYKQLDRRWQDWTAVRAQCAAVADEMLARTSTPTSGGH